MPPARIMVTGGSGFVGAPLVRRLLDQGHSVVAPLRRPPPRPGRPGLTLPQIAGIGAKTDWRPLLEGVDVVVHCAAHVHARPGRGGDPDRSFREVNVDGTRALAEQAARAGVRRVVFVSSIKVNGEFTLGGQAFGPADAPAPQDAYARSKLQAERALAETLHGNGTDWVAVRPPLVAGPGVKGNLLSLLHAVDRGWPLPFARIDNRRSLLALDNLVDILLTCAFHPEASRQVFVAADGEDLSTPELVRAIAGGLGRRPRLLGVPVALLRAAALATGRRATLARVAGDLRVDASALASRLGWRPRIGTREGLHVMARWYREAGPG